MMPKRSIIYVTIITILVGCLFIFIAGFFTALRKNAQITADLASKCKMIASLAEKSKMPITKESEIFLIDEQKKLKNLYGRFRLALTSPLGEKPSADELDSLKFKERLIQTQKGLREEARRHNLSLPKSLGFAKYETELSKPHEIPYLIKQLKTLEELINTMISSNIDSLYEINFAEAVAKKDKRLEVQDGEAAELNIGETPQPGVISKENSFFYDIQASFKIGCTSNKLIDFLYKLRISPYFFIVDDMDIEASREGEGRVASVGSLKASFSIRAVVLN